MEKAILNCFAFFLTFGGFLAIIPPAESPAAEQRTKTEERTGRKEGTVCQVGHKKANYFLITIIILWSI